MRSGLGGEHRLATYGSLRPGERHHGLVAGLELVGTGSVRGRLTEWAGYPVLSLDPDGAAVPVALLEGVTESMWVELDAFEGPAYRRVLVEVVLETGDVLVAACYVAAEG